MKGKELERRCVLQADRYRRDRDLTMARYGVHGVLVDGQWRPIDSLPDFEGVLPGGRQFIFEAKVCNQASFPLDDDKFKARQYKHLMERSEFGVITFLLIYFPERRLKTKVDAPLLVAFPVNRSMEFWSRFETGEIKRISRDDAIEYGVELQWTEQQVPKPLFLHGIKVLERRLTCDLTTCSPATSSS